MLIVVLCYAEGAEPRAAAMAGEKSDKTARASYPHKRVGARVQTVSGGRSSAGELSAVSGLVLGQRVRLFRLGRYFSGPSEGGFGQQYGYDLVDDGRGNDRAGYDGGKG